MLTTETFRPTPPAFVRAARVRTIIPDPCPFAIGVVPEIIPSVQKTVPPDAQRHAFAKSIWMM